MRLEKTRWPGKVGRTEEEKMIPERSLCSGNSQVAKTQLREEIRTEGDECARRKRIPRIHSYNTKRTETELHFFKWRTQFSWNVGEEGWYQPLPCWAEVSAGQEEVRLGACKRKEADRRYLLEEAGRRKDGGKAVALRPLPY
jgi:hypothetical protein